MDQVNWLDVVLRWMHILAAVTAAGGTLFARFALLPSLEETLAPEQRQALHASIRGRWSKIVAASIAFLLVSGLVNFINAVRLYDLPKFYHALFGVKFLLALGVFFIASVVSGRSALAERFRRDARKWLSINAVLVVLIVLISGVLKVAEKTKKPAQPAAAMKTRVEDRGPWPATLRQ
ncbi:MAG: hypothetical protein DCC68_06320 [Planctomycetota bacterium]|nr:MAG: hypothetical protein DCC68_06320 [Planctomycetota bacterium]